MSIPRFFVPLADLVHEGTRVPLGAAQARHLWVLRLPQGSALELVLPSGPWRAELAETSKDQALARLVAPLKEDREPPVPITAYVPVTAQLSLLDDLLPPLVELGATAIQPVVFRRSEYDAGKTAARLDRWQRIIHGACEQSHRSRVPAFAAPLAFEALLELRAGQRWVAHEVPSGRGNPTLTRDPISFTSGPEGGLSDGEFSALAAAGWQAVHLGGSILRAVTCPVALMGAIRFQLP